MVGATQLQHQRALHGLVLGAAALLLLLALWPCEGSNLLGLCGHALDRLLVTAFGEGAWLIPLFLFDQVRSGGRARWSRYFAMFGVLVFACTTLHLVGGLGGRLGAVVGNFLLLLLGLGAYLACLVALLVFVSRKLEWSPAKTLGMIVWSSRRRLLAAWRTATARELTQHSQAAIALSSRSVSQLKATVSGAPRDAVAPTVLAEVLEQASTTGPASDAPPDPEEVLAPASEPAAGEVAVAEPDPARAAATGGESTSQPYRLPTPWLLTAGPCVARVVDEREHTATALKLEQRLASYGIAGRVDGLTPGPVVTMYEFEPRPGTKLSSISRLVAELSMALEQGVRIIAPLPGTARVGIEVPHPEHDREIVYLRELVEDERWEHFVGTLPLALGKHPNGQPVFCDLGAAPHLLVAGATGTGKSCGLNAMLASLLLQRTPDEVRLILIDPKVVELKGFEHIPHLLVPVITEVKEAARALQWAVGEMERRYRLLAAAGARNITTYNQREDATALPSIVVVVDEFADLMMADTKEKRLEAAIARLAQKARAAGIHLILATQRPSVDVITGLIKANLPTRIAYRVAQRVDSQVILECRGAEHLLGRGDMLCRLPGSPELQRVHGAYVSDEEIKAVCDAMRGQRAPEYDAGILAPASESSSKTAASDADDPFYDRAVEHVVAAGCCSISALQRGLNVGYNKAALLVERLERNGVVGPASKRAGGKRDVLIPVR